MQASDIRAEPNPRGGRIDLSWTNPSAPGFAGVKVLRRETAYPELADIGTAVEIHDEPAASAPAGTTVRLVDDGLKPETVYYYSIVAYDAVPAFSAPARASAMATAPYLTALHLYHSLPGVYRNYDDVLPPDVVGLEPADRTRGQLRRFLDMFGPQFDLLRSFASGVRNFHDLGRVDGDLLPLLASWIGWATNSALDFDKQRNEIRYAPHFYRTAGVSGNLHATINRLVTWDARIKEFVHNVFLSTYPEQLTLWEQERRDGTWQALQTLTLDVAYEGRPSPLLTSDNREWLFYHARESAPLAPAAPASTSAVRTKSANQDHFHIRFKTREDDEWQPSCRVTRGAAINKHPAAVADGDDRIWLFWADYPRQEAEGRVTQLRLSLLSAGRAPRPARARSTNSGPFSFADGDRFSIAVVDGAQVVTRAVTFRREHFRDITSATPGETAALLEREIPGVTVTAAEDGSVLFRSRALGAGAVLQFPASPVAAALGLGAPAGGADAVAARLLGNRSGPFALADGDSIAIELDGRTTRIVTFRPGDFVNIAQATAAEVAAAVNRTLPGVASAVANRVVLTSPAAGADSLLVVEVYAALLATLPSTLVAALDGGTLTAAVRDAFLAQGLPLSPEATAQVQVASSRWLVSSDGRAYQVRSEGGRLNVYSRALGEQTLGFGAPVAPVPAPADDCEPSAFRDASGGIWLFWSSRRNGRFKIWYDRCNAPVAAWQGARPLTLGPEADREPFALFEPAGGGRIWVFWSRKKPNGLWNVFFRTTAELDFANLADGDWTERELTPVPPDYDNREPAGLVPAAGGVELYFASNRGDGWHVWTKGITTAAQGADARLSTGFFTHRAPAPLRVSSQRQRLFVRTNRGQEYTSAFYPSARTVDHRYSGAIAVDTRNAAKIGGRRALGDIERYTYETQKGEDNWYARDVVGIYLTPDTIDQALVIRRRSQIETVLRRFLPIQVRTVFVSEQVVPEFVYTYDAPFVQPSVLIGERVVDSLLGEVFRDLADTHLGDTANFRWLRSWDETHPDASLPDLGVVPPNLSFRLPLRGVGEEEPGG